jgi:hypothetical protein
MHVFIGLGVVELIFLLFVLGVFLLLPLMALVDVIRSDFKRGKRQIDLGSRYPLPEHHRRSIILLYWP